MALSDDVATLQTTLTAQAAAIKASFGRKVANAALADNALTLTNLSPTDLVALASARSDAHAALTGNPHFTGAADLSMYTSAQIDAAIATLVPSGIIPLSQFGSPDQTVPLPISISGTNVVLTAGVPLFMAGTAYTLPAFNVALANNASNYVYMRLVAGIPSIVATATYVPESLTNALIGVVTLSGGSVTKNTLAKFTRVDIYRISTVAAGTAIPVSGGDPATPAALLWS